MTLSVRIYGIVATIALAVAIVFTSVTFSNPITNLELKSTALFLFSLFAIYPAILASLDIIGKLKILLYFISIVFITIILIFAFRGIAPIPEGREIYYIHIKIYLVIANITMFICFLLKKYLQLSDLFIPFIILIPPLAFIILVYLFIRRLISLKKE